MCHVLHKTSHQEISRPSRALTAKKCTNKCNARVELWVVVLVIKPFAFLTSWSLLKLLNWCGAEQQMLELLTQQYDEFRLSRFYLIYYGLILSFYFFFIEKYAVSHSRPFRLETEQVPLASSHSFERYFLVFMAMILDSIRTVLLLRCRKTRASFKA